jgi:hypothetical protein
LARRAPKSFLASSPAAIFPKRCFHIVDSAAFKSEQFTSGRSSAAERQYWAKPFASTGFSLASSGYIPAAVVASLPP